MILSSKPGSFFCHLGTSSGSKLLCRSRGTWMSIGGTAATSVNVVDATTITASTPAGSAGTASVLVTTPYGTNAANTLFTYVAPPTVTSISPTSGTTLGGTSVTITGTNLTGATAVTIGGTAATGVNVVDATTITATTPAGSAGTASVLVTTPGGTNAANTLFTYFTPAPEIAVFDGNSTAPANERTDNAPGAFDFGSVNMGSSSTAQTFTIQNLGTATADLTGLAVTSTNATEFTFTAPLVTTLAPNATTTFTVSFSPSAAGARTGVINLASNDADENPFEINVGGTGTVCIPNYTAANIPVSFSDISGTGTTVTGLGDDSLSGAIPLPFSFDFYGLAQNTLYISSNGFITFLPGGSDGCCSGQSLPDPNSPNGLIAGGWTDLYPGGNGTVSYQTLGSVGSRVFIVMFKDIPRCCDNTPAYTFNIKLYEATNVIEVHVVDNFNSGTMTIGLENYDGTASTTSYHGNGSVSNQAFRYTPTCGVVMVPEIAVEQPVGTDRVDGTASVDFGTRNVAETSSLTFTVRNTDAAPLSLGALTFTGANATDFSVTTAPAASVAGYGSTTFVIAFTPLQSGARSAVLHLANNDSNENPFDITLTGTGNNTIGSTLPNGTTPILTVPSGDFVATGLNFGTTLGFQPTPGSAYTFVNIVGSGNSIIGNFNDLPDGGVVAMAFNGVIYYFQVDYADATDLNDLTLTSFTPAAAPAWRWTAGPNKRNNAAKFGTLNVAAATNNPGSRQGAMNWRGTDGSLWMFGGYGYATAVTNPPNGLNDLWQYDRTLGQWTWRSGSAAQGAAAVYGSITVEAAGNTPGARHTGSTWTDSSNNLWLLGGFNGNATFPSRYNDLWRYRPSTGRWTWMKGSSGAGQAGVYGTQGVAAAGNTPGARQGSASWFTPDGNLWLFGGFDGTAYFNDLWSYNLASGMWTWVSGSTTTGAFGVYGTQGTAAAANVPGARREATGGWVDAAGNLWMFGGLGLPASGVAGNLNDLWKYDRSLGQWTWIKGSDTINPAGVYGTQGTPDAANTPGGRSGGKGWATVDGKFWLVGGFTNSTTIQSDVWIYDSSTNQWVWTLGANTNNARGVYGTLGVADPANQPGARFTASTWVTLNGALWIFGGGGTDAFGSSGRLSDLWSYSIPPPAGAPLLPAAVPFPESFTINAAPTTNNAAAGTMAYVPVSGQLTGKDTDGDIILFGTTGTTLSHGTLTLQSNGQWTYAPAPGYVGTDTFTFKASDYYGGQSPTRTLTITVATNPADADNDGIPDTYEQSTFGSTGVDALGDADGDGQSNYFEYLAGTNPVDAAQTLTTAPSIAAGASANGGSFKLDLSHVRPGVNYHLETSSDLDVWNRIGTFTFSVSGSATIEDPTAPTGQPAFYRISLEAPALLP